MPLVSRPNISRAKSEIRAGGKAGVKQALTGVKQRHDAIVKPWKIASDRPGFVIKIEEIRDKIVGSVVMIAKEAEQASISVWQLLERGTRIRFMKLSDDWVSKTWPGRLSSGSGGGHKMGIDTNDPEGGITGRNWAETVAEAQKTSTDTAIQEGWKNGFRNGIGR